MYAILILIGFALLGVLFTLLIPIFTFIGIGVVVYLIYKFIKESTKDS